VIDAITTYQELKMCHEYLVKGLFLSVGSRLSDG